MTVAKVGSAVSPPDVHDIGDPRYRGRGVNIGFPTCQLGNANGMVFLQRINVFNGNCEGELPLLVIRHDTASSSFFQCPTFNLCDDPVFTKVCLGTNLRTCRNPMPPYPRNATCSTRYSVTVAAWRR